MHYRFTQGDGKKNCHMNCVHCQRELPEDYRVEYCPFCGRDLVVEAADATPPVRPEPGNWLKFFIFLFAPAVICFASMAIGLYGLAALVSIFGSLAAGLASARILMQNVAATGFQRGLLHFFIAIVLIGLSVFVTAMGCGLGLSTSGRHF